MEPCPRSLFAMVLGSYEVDWGMPIVVSFPLFRSGAALLAASPCGTSKIQF
jgi:hypothetical protein